MKKNEYRGNNANSLLIYIVVGILKGYDQLMNLVLDDVQETLRGGTRGLEDDDVQS